MYLNHPLSVQCEELQRRGFRIIESISFAFFVLLFLINITIAIKFSVEGCKEKKRKNILMKKRAELIKKRDEKRAKAVELKNSVCD